MAKVKNCGYKHCRCDTKEIPSGTEVKVSNRWYHAQCAKESQEIREIKKLYYDCISSTVVQNVLGKVVNDIVYGKNIATDYFLFAIQYAINHKLRVSSPYGLHYLIDNRKVKDEWAKRQAKSLRKNIVIDFDFNQADEVTFTNKTNVDKGFGNILKGV